MSDNEKDVHLKLLEDTDICLQNFPGRQHVTFILM